MNQKLVDVFSSEDWQTDDRIASQSQHTLLGPGDVLYMPPGWFHSLRSASQVCFVLHNKKTAALNALSSQSFSVSMWF